MSELVDNIPIGDKETHTGNWLAIGSIATLVVLWTLLYTTPWLPTFAILIAVILVLFIAAIKGNPGLMRVKWQTGRLLWVSLVTAALFYLCYMSVSLFLHRHYPYALQKWELIASLRYRYRLIPAIFLFGLVACGEEMYWRGYIQTAIASRIGRDKAIYATALLYAAIHIPANAPLLFFSALLAAIYWGWIYSRTRTIWVTLLAHTSWAIVVAWQVPFDLTGSERYVALVKSLLVV